MKKISIFISFLLILAGVSSCDMDKFPHDQLPAEIQNYSDAKSARIGMYSNLKVLMTGGYVQHSDFSTDWYHATIDWQSWRIQQYLFNFDANDESIKNLWYGFNSGITTTNYVITGIAKVLSESNLTSEQIDELNLWNAEAHWIRAYCLYQMSTLWCEAYDPATAASKLGLPRETRFNPSSDGSTYPGRSNLEDTFGYILDDLKVAEDTMNELNVQGVSNSYYITKDAVAALGARIALWMREWETAASYANSLIESNKYPLVNNATSLEVLLEQDKGSEIIFMAQIKDATDGGSAYGGDYFIYQLAGVRTPQPRYIPEQWVLDLYADGDIRKAAYFKETTIGYDIFPDKELMLIYKFPGNPDLSVTHNVSNAYKHKGKVFRIGEAYLIAVEAYAKAGNVTRASSLLNEFRGKRISGWVEQSYTTAVQIEAEIKNERTRELLGEGFRFSDLKRWGDGFRRSEPQDADIVETLENSHILSVEASNFRFVWPIPLREIEMNPNMAGQQNPGYTSN